MIGENEYDMDAINWELADEHIAQDSSEEEEPDEIQIQSDATNWLTSTPAQVGKQAKNAGGVEIPKQHRPMARWRWS